MMRYFPTPAAQELAIKRLLVFIGQSTSIFSQEFIDEIDGSDHEITAAIKLKLVDLWIDGRGGVHLRVSQEGREWLLVYQKLSQKAKNPDTYAAT